MNLFGAAPRSQQSRFVDRVGEVGAGKSGSRLRDLPQVQVWTRRFAAQMHPQNSFAPFQVWRIDHHLPVESPRTQ